jgi:branched-chain amino acid transport system permease protein
VTDYLEFFLLGLGAGALYAALSQGIVLAYRGAGVINFAVGATAMFIGYIYAGLRAGRVMVPPLPNPLVLIEAVTDALGSRVRMPRIPTFLEFAPLPSFVAIVVALAVAALLGLVLHGLVFSRLRNASPLSKTVAAVGVMLTLQAMVILRYADTNIGVPPIMPQELIRVGDASIPLDRFILASFALLLSLGLVLWSRYTTAGLASAAAAENERGATLLGLPVSRLAALNWALSCMVAGAAGILYSMVTGLNPVEYVLFVVPALGAALLARFHSFGVAAVAGVVIGGVQALTLPLQQDISWLPKTGLFASVPFVIIFFAIILRGQRLPTRATAAQIRLPAAPEPTAVGRRTMVLVALFVAGIVFLPSDLRGGLLNSAVGAIMALSLVLVAGFGGQISLMQMTIAGIASVMMTRLAGDWGLPFPIAPALAILVAAVCGVLAGLPALRVRGVQLAILTLGAAYAIEHLVFRNPSVLRPSDAASIVPAPSLFGLRFDVNGHFPFGSHGAPNAWFGIFVLTVLVACCFAVVRVRRSALGLRLLALRSNERAAAALGINVRRTKLSGFALGALFAGAAGVISAYQFGGVTADRYTALSSVSVLAIAYLGGISTVSGALIAGFLAVGGLNIRILERLFELGRFELLIAGVGLVYATVVHPEGIAGFASHVKQGLIDKARRRRAARERNDTAGWPSAADYSVPKSLQAQSTDRVAR